MGYFCLLPFTDKSLPMLGEPVVYAAYHVWKLIGISWSLWWDCLVPEVNGLVSVTLRLGILPTWGPQAKVMVWGQPNVPRWCASVLPIPGLLLIQTYLKEDPEFLLNLRIIFYYILQFLRASSFNFYPDLTSHSI